MASLTTDLVFFYWSKDLYVDHQTDAPVAAVKAWERGFYPIYTKATPETLNAPRGWTPEVLEAAHLGSLCGWNCPGARAAVDAVLAIEKAEAIAERIEQ